MINILLSSQNNKYLKKMITKWNWLHREINMLLSVSIAIIRQEQ